MLEIEVGPGIDMRRIVERKVRKVIHKVNKSPFQILEMGGAVVDQQGWFNHVSPRVSSLT
jgi:hypothetical protein